jgi:hypothetical protein
MDLIKKHYEKVLLGLVLLLAMVAVGLLLFWIPNEKARLEDERTAIIQRQPKPLTNLDLTFSSNVTKTLNAPLGADFGRPHNLVNPVQWQKAPDGKLVKLERGNEVGPEAAVVTNTTPLYLILTFDSVGATSAGGTNIGYMIGIEKQASPVVEKRRKKQTVARLNEKKEDTFTLREIKGPPENPTELVVELSDTGDRVSLSKEKPYKRVEGYLASIRYDPEKKSFPARRMGDKVIINSERYNIVAITENEVVVLQELTGKKFTIRKKAENSQS